VPDIERIAHAYLYAGVTTAFILQGNDDIRAYAARVERGDALAPHLVLAGERLTAPDGFPINVYSAVLPWPLSALLTRSMRPAADATAARAIVDDIHAQSSPAIMKITQDAFPPETPKLTDAAFVAAIVRANERGMISVAHIGAPEDFLVASRAGLALFAHPPSSAVFTDEQVAELVRARVPFCSTQRYLTGPDDVAKDDGTALERAVATPALIDAIAHRPADFTFPAAGGGDVDAMLARYRDNLRANLVKLHAARAVVFVGTDAGSPGVIPGASLHRELRLLVDAGFTPAEALAAATSAPAAFVQQRIGGPRFGVVAVGARADLVLVDGDPLADISRTEAVTDVFLDGKRVAR
jgi:imidazolonepropionase-like amidohydrolase